MIYTIKVFEVKHVIFRDKYGTKRYKGILVNPDIIKNKFGRSWNINEVEIIQTQAVEARRWYY